MQTQLPRRPFVELPPPPDGLLRARREAARRRTRRTVACIGGAAAAGLVGVVALLAGGGADVAIVRPAPVTPATHAPTPVSTGAPSVAHGPTSSYLPAAHPSTGVMSVRPAGGTEAAGPSRPSSAAAPAQGSVTVVRSQGRYTGYPRVCRTGDQANNGSVQPGADWCSDATASVESKGERLSLQVCRDSTTGGTLTFPTTREVDFAVMSHGRTIWSWSHDHPGSSAPHTLSAAADGCWVWSVVWPGVSQDGRPVAHGSFTLVATSTAQEMRGAPASQVSFNF